jgi:hypothetical protein
LAGQTRWAKPEVKTWKEFSADTSPKLLIDGFPKSRQRLHGGAKFSIDMLPICDNIEG